MINKNEFIGLRLNYLNIDLPRSTKSDFDIAKSSHSDSSLDITELTKGMKSLDEESYRLFFNAYYRRLRAYLYILTNGNDSVIEDALQLTFAKIVKSIRVFETDGELWAWLAVITRNAYIDCKRKEGRFHRLKAMFQLNDDEQWFDPIQQQLDCKEQYLDRALLTLEKHDRYLIERKYFDGASYRELATEQGTTVKSIESRLGRIRSRLRQAIQEDIER